MIMATVSIGKEILQDIKITRKQSLKYKACHMLSLDIDNMANFLFSSRRKLSNIND